MKWETDLIKDIRYHNEKMDNQEGLSEPPYDDYLQQYYPDTEFGNLDWQWLMDTYSNVKDKCKFILEIGSYRSNTRSSTQCFFNIKNKETIYLGVDLVNLSHINDPVNNIYTIQTNSCNVDEVKNKIFELGCSKIDFLFIDGNHNINQVLNDWEYTSLLSDHGTVAFHDTQHSSGPRRFVLALDPDKWDVQMYPSRDFLLSIDYKSFGLTFVTLK